jgi:hypothetical protein
MLWACGLLQRASRPSPEQAAGRRDRDLCLAWRSEAPAQRPVAREVRLPTAPTAAAPGGFSSLGLAMRPLVLARCSCLAAGGRECS